MSNDITTKLLWDSGKIGFLKYGYSCGGIRNDKGHRPDIIYIILDNNSIDREVEEWIDTMLHVCKPLTGIVIVESHDNVRILR